jgi:dinuclear metal center YbgI/SA1388 family protein
MRLAELTAYLDETLAAHVGADYGPNGLQVEGRQEVRRLVTGVSACQELFVRAAQAGADAVLVHHGLFWDFQAPVRLTGHLGQRVATLVRHDLSLLAYHLPLDRHPEFGNNVLAARGLGLESLVPFAEHAGVPVGFRGHFSPPISPQELTARCAGLFGQEPLACLHGPASVRTLGMVSGGAQRNLYTAIDARLDAFVTGEISEWVMNVAREESIHYLACGHHATERLGVRALGEHLAQRFGLTVEFLDVPNPV